MGELSDRFGELMARMAKGDAELFRPCLCLGRDTVMGWVSNRAKEGENHGQSGQCGAVSYLPRPFLCTMRIVRLLRRRHRPNPPRQP
jgi:hypothetical protein